MTTVHCDRCGRPIKVVGPPPEKMRCMGCQTMGRRVESPRKKARRHTRHTARRDRTPPRA